MLLVLAWISAVVFLSTSWISCAVVSSFSIPLEYTMFYRLMIASAVTLVLIPIFKQRVKIMKTEILASVLVAGSQLNVWLASYASKYLISGLIPCVMLMQIFVAEIMGACVERRKLNKKIMLSGVIGAAGILMLCNQQLHGVGDVDVKKTLIGIFFSFIATFAAAFGNIVYEKSGKSLRNMPKLTFMLYNFIFSGIFFLLLGLILRPVSGLVSADLLNVKYMANLVFLAITASLLALLGVYYIIAKQGAIKCTYINFIMPILAMVISTVMEGFVWNAVAVLGMLTLMFSVWFGMRS